MSKEYTKTSSSKDKSNGQFDNYSNGSEKITVYTSNSGKTAVFKNGKKVNKG